MKRAFTMPIAVLLAATILVACGGNEEAQQPTEKQSPAEERSPTKVTIEAQDFRFEMPATITGGLVEVSYINRGKEAHFAGIAKPAAGKSYEDVKAAFLAISSGPPPGEPAPVGAPPAGPPPAGPPPFEEFAGIATADSGEGNRVTLNLPAGTYAFYCLVPSPDGVSHVAKGMIQEVNVTEGSSGTVEEGDATLVGTDFAYDRGMVEEAGTSVVRLRNEGKQFHEINLVEVPSGKTMDDVIAWHRQMTGPPPVRFLGGVAIKAGEEATATFDLKEGTTYAFICAIPDSLGDFTSHVVKGMYTQPVRVS